MAVSDENFMHYYQKMLFESRNNEQYTLCSAKRKCLSQLYLSSIKSASNDASCLFLEEELNPYTSLVDKVNKDGINNYARPSMALAGHNVHETHSWKCKLPSSEEIVSKFTKPLNCEFAINSIPERCSTWDATEDDVQNLLTEENVSHMDSYEGEPKEMNVVANSGPDRTPGISIKKQEDSYSRKSFQSENKLCQDNRPETSFQQSNLFLPNYNKKSFQSNAFNSDNNCQKPPLQSNPGGNQPQNVFRTAREELGIQSMKKWGSAGPSDSRYAEANNNSGQKKSLGARRGVMNKFVPPIHPNARDDFEGQFGVNQGQFGVNQKQKNSENNGPEIDERLKHIDPEMVELVRNEIMDIGTTITWDDIAGLEFAKSTIQEAVVWPLLRPDIFTGLRRPPKGILLFGPPGTGKTLIGKCIASQSNSTFFSISASSITSKWIGNGEKMVRALFAVARCHQPAVVFIDEIDSLLTQRSDTEHESSRRIKTEFLVQLDGTGTGEEDRVLVIGATNRPQELDEAARRRLVKKLYIPLPDLQSRSKIILRLMSSENHCLSEESVQEIAVLTDGYSGADMKCLCQEASLGPIRSLGFADIQNIQPHQVRPVAIADFKSALTRVRASVAPGDLDNYVAWDKMYGSGGVN